MCIPAAEFSNVGPFRAVYFDGPHAALDATGGQSGTDLAWTVYVGDADAEPVGQIYTLHHFKSAELLAQRMAEDRRLDLIHEATPA
ncbi:MAG: hypothetical protein WCH99_19960 [Verrucomicrobiota bacterium]